MLWVFSTATTVVGAKCCSSGCMFSRTSLASKVPSAPIVLIWTPESAEAAPDSYFRM
jgi:hypothetical protein